MILWKSMESIWFSMYCLQWLIEIMYLGACPKVIVNWNNQVEHTHAQQQSAAQWHRHSVNKKKKKNKMQETIHMHTCMNQYMPDTSCIDRCVAYWFNVHMPMLVNKSEMKNQHSEKSIQNAIFQKKILTILTTAMSKRRGNSLMLARLTMPLEGNICIQRGAFFCENRVFCRETLYPYVLAGVHHMLDHIKFGCWM